MNIFTVGDLVTKLDTTSRRVKEIKATVRSNNQTVRDIEDYFKARDTVRELKPVKDKLDPIKWPPSREKYAAEHKAELDQYQKAVWLRDKLVKKLADKLQIPIPFDASARKQLKEKLKELNAETEALRPELTALEPDLEVLKKLRYWTRKVIPEALPDPDKTSVENEMEKAANRRDLERDMDAAVAAAVHSPDDKPQEQKQRDLERRTKPLHRKTDEPTH